MIYLLVDALFVLAVVCVDAVGVNKVLLDVPAVDNGTLDETCGMDVCDVGPCVVSGAGVNVSLVNVVGACVVVSTVADDDVTEAVIVCVVGNV